MMAVAVLCAQPNSNYNGIEGVEVFDRKRDARTFAGGMPTVIHPPCRAWSAFTRHQAKPEPGEKELGLWCVEQFRQCGGVMEHPAHSRLFAAAGLPGPGWRNAGAALWTIEVYQAWWGYPVAKKTWLCFCGISPMDIQLPLQLHGAGRDWRTFQLMSKHQRSRTTPAFAAWLIAAARKARL